MPKLHLYGNFMVCEMDGIGPILCDIFVDTYGVDRRRWRLKVVANHVSKEIELKFTKAPTCWRVE